MCITEYFVLFKKTKNPIPLLKAIYLIVKQRRCIEVAWSIYCFIRFKPSQCFSEDIDEKLIASAVSCVRDLYPLFYSRAELIRKFGSEYNLGKLPADFFGARSTSIVKIGEHLIIGEYAEDSARIIISTKSKLRVESYYQSISGVRHIHLICSGFSEDTVFVSTGDGYKYLDCWGIKNGRLTFSSRIKSRLAGYTGSVDLLGVKYFGTDFSSRPNYIETLSGEKHFFPFPAYSMFVESLASLDDRYLVSLNVEHSPLGSGRCLSIFDVILRKFVYCRSF